MQLLVLILEKRNQRAAHGSYGVFAQLLGVQTEFTNRLCGLLGALNSRHCQAPGKHDLPGFKFGKLGSFRESRADLPGIFGQLFVGLLLLRCNSGVRLFADKLLGHLIEHILPLLELSGDVFNRCFIVCDSAFGAVHLGFFLGEGHAFAGDGKLIDHHHQSDQQPDG